MDDGDILSAEDGSGGVAELALKPKENWWSKPMDELDEVPEELQEELSAEPDAMPEMLPPPSCTVNLLPFQRESLWWMTRQERSGYRGGILADEMGMGKTIQAIALILTNRDDGPLPLWECGSLDHGSHHSAGAGSSSSAVASPLPLPGPPPYESEGAVREREEYEKAAGKAAKAAYREAVRVAKEEAKASKSALKANSAAVLEAAAIAKAERAAEREAMKLAKEVEKAIKEADREAEKARKSAVAEEAIRAKDVAKEAAAAGKESKGVGKGKRGISPGKGKGSVQVAASAPAAETAPDLGPALANKASFPDSVVRAEEPPEAVEAGVDEPLEPAPVSTAVMNSCKDTEADGDRSVGSRMSTSASLFEQFIKAKSLKGKGIGAEEGSVSASASPAAAPSPLSMLPPNTVTVPPFVSSWKAQVGSDANQLDHLAPGPVGKATLVVCPVVALTQWRSEIVKHTAPGSLRVIIYHGPNRHATAAELASYDVVLTTYSVLEAEFRKMMEPTKIKCQWCSKSLLRPKLAIHLRYFCGPDAVKTEKQSKQERKKARNSSGGGSGAGATRLGDDEGDDVMVIDGSDEEESEEEEVEEKTPPPSKAKGKPWLVKKSPSSDSQKMKQPWSDGAGVAGKSKGGAAVASAGGKHNATVGSSTRKLVSSSAAAPVNVSGPGSKRSSSGAGGKGPASRPTGKSAKSGKKGGDSDDEEEDDDDYEDESDASNAGEDGKDEVEDDEEEEEEEEVSAERGKRRRSVGAGSTGARSTSKSKDKAAPSFASSAPMKLGAISVLQQVHWKRLMLDEAHAIKNKRAGTSKAVFALTAERRWCLSGTPLQNRVSELFSMIRFLRIKPFGYYFCKNCPCASLDYRFDAGGRACEMCGHSPLRHYQWLNKYVMNPIRAYGYIGPGLEGMRVLRKQVLDDLVLRRTKAGRAADLALPLRTILLRDDLELDAYEADFYQALYTQSQARFGAYVASGTLLQNYAHLFDLLTRLRQAVDHPFLILYGNSAMEAAAAAAIAVEDEGGESSAGAGFVDVCGICRESVEEAVLTGCKHAFCTLCMREYLESFGGRARSMLKDRTHDAAAFIGMEGGDGGGEILEDEEEEEEGGTKVKKRGKAVSKGGSSGSGKSKAKTPSSSPGAGTGIDEGQSLPTCPTCYAPLTVDLTPGALVQHNSSAKRRGILSRIPADRIGAAFKSSTKIEALLEDLWRCQEEEPGAKALVFSQFVNMLDLIQHRLTHAGVRCVKMDGGMTVAARDRVINAFKDDPHVTVFLISLKAGGVALNLTAASRIYLMDPWWNPAAEFQALDRTHRLGQHRSITAVRFIVRGTIEERIVALQDKKRLVFEGTVGADAGSLARLTEEDMRFLFQ